jgi:hypothetical protein
MFWRKYSTGLRRDNLGRECSFMAAKILPRARRQAARLHISLLMAPLRQPRAFTFDRASKSADRAICFCLRELIPRGSPMFESRAALFPLQKDGFSCHDAHAFNRNSSSQVKARVQTNRFAIVTGSFSLRSSLRFLSFHSSPRPVLFRFVTDKFQARANGSSWRAITMST